MNGFLAFLLGAGLIGCILIISSWIEDYNEVKKRAYKISILKEEINYLKNAHTKLENDIWKIREDIYKFKKRVLPYFSDEKDK